MSCFTYALILVPTLFLLPFPPLCFFDCLVLCNIVQFYPTCIYHTSYPWESLFLPLGIPLLTLGNPSLYPWESLFLPLGIPLLTLGNPSSYPWESLFLPLGIPLPTLGNPSSYPWESLFLPLGIPLPTLGNPSSYPWESLFLPCGLPPHTHFPTLVSLHSEVAYEQNISRMSTCLAGDICFTKNVGEEGVEVSQVTRSD